MTTPRGLCAARASVDRLREQRRRELARSLTPGRPGVPERSTTPPRRCPDRSARLLAQSLSGSPIRMNPWTASFGRTSDATSARLPSSVYSRMTRRRRRPTSRPAASVRTRPVPGTDLEGCPGWRVSQSWMVARAGSDHPSSRSNSRTSAERSFRTGDLVIRGQLRGSRSRSGRPR